MRDLEGARPSFATYEFLGERRYTVRPTSLAISSRVKTRALSSRLESDGVVGRRIQDEIYAEMRTRIVHLVERKWRDLEDGDYAIWRSYGGLCVQGVRDRRYFR